MRATRISIVCLLVLSLLSWPVTASRPSVGDDDVFTMHIAQDQVVFELVGQVKNAPPAGPGLPATSVQYGYLSLIKGLDQIFTTADPTLQNEATAMFTFFNEGVTQRVIANGPLRIINREGTSTIYFNSSPSGDLTTPNPDSFRSGTPIMRLTWRHQVVFEPSPSGHFFVHFEYTVTSTDSFIFNGREVRIGKSGDQFRLNLFGVPDPAGKVNGKFSGYAVGLKAKS
jgi:hypothetical protein